MRDRREIYLDILYWGLLNALSAGWAGDAEQAAAEADHLHNLPELFRHFDDEALHVFYWEAMRGSYLTQSKPDYAERFAQLWRELEAANRASPGYATAPPMSESVTAKARLAARRGEPKQ